MARKKSEKKAMPATAEKTRPVRLDLSPDLHRKLRMVAADEDKAMAELAREAVEIVIGERYDRLTKGR
jgi:predicted  nucleic acid-binding Zn-ribbon protein